LDAPWQEDVHRVLPFSKICHHIKFQVIISNGCQVLEAIPSEKCDAAVFGSSILAQKISSIIHLLKILAFVATITAINNYHGTNQKRENRFSTNQEAAVIILAQ
jgi:hypothetical protein